MNRKIAVVVLALALYTATEAQKVSGKLSFQQGDTIAVSVVMKNSVMQDAGGQTIDFTVDGTAEHYFNVTNTNADNTTVHHGAKQITFKFDGMGQKMNFNSDNPKDQKGMMGKPMQEMLAKKYDMIMDPAGKALVLRPEKIELPKVDERMMVINNMLKDLTGVVFPPAKNGPSFFSVLPATEVGIGDTWKENSNTDTDKSTTDYTLKAIGDSTITVDYNTVTTTQLRSTIMGVEAVTSMKTTMAGTILLDKLTGIIREKNGSGNSVGKMDAMGTTMPLSAKSTILIKVKKISQ